ncbi:MAG: hypothetical protein DBY32_04020 [Phascolarctobacterium sp.]|nr:MAG: hypothetical protein DBY32_04020 [Phascolarctobacterium sp.]
MRERKTVSVGDIYGEWTVIKDLNKEKALCRCTCGNIKEVSKYNLVQGHTKSCGCYGKAIKIGAQYGEWTVIAPIDEFKVLCRCSCGTERPVFKMTLRSGRSKSCGKCRAARKLAELKKEFIGAKFGYWTIIDIVDTLSALCECVCGTRRVIRIAALKAGRTLSCGCKRTENRDPATVADSLEIGQIIKDAAHNEGLTLTYFRKNINKNSSTGVTGVCRSIKKDGKVAYRAYITVNRKQIGLGEYDTLQEAASARKYAEDKYFKPRQERADKIKADILKEIREQKAEKELQAAIPKIENNARRPRTITNMAERTCTVCGIKFLGGPSAKYCPECRLKIRRERDREQKRRGTRRPIGSIDVCAACGKEYIVESGKQKYCPECAAEEIKKKDRERGKEYAAEQRAKNPDKVREWKRRKYYDTKCIICGKAFTPTNARRKTCSDECQQMWRRYRTALAKWKYDAKRGERYNMPTLENFKKI